MRDKQKYRVAIYCRVAREDDGAAQMQLRTLRAFSKELGFPAPAEYVDNGYSGLSPDRPAFARMNEDIRAGCFNAVLVKDMARVYRDFRLFHAWLEDMRKRGVALHTPNREVEGQLRTLRQICKLPM